MMLGKFITFIENLILYGLSLSYIFLVWISRNIVIHCVFHYPCIFFSTVMIVSDMNTHSRSKLSRKMDFLVHGVHGIGKKIS